MVKINASLLPVKAHYFFFMAGMGPILPFLPVMGKQLGISEIAMGLIMSVIPILFLFAKPIFGFIADYFQSKRKTVFIALVISTTVLFSLLQVIPSYKEVSLEIPCKSVDKCVNESYVEGNFCQVSFDSMDILPQKVLSVNKSYCSVEEWICPTSQALVKLSCGSTSSEFYSSFSFWAFVVLLSAGSIGYNVANSVSDAICFDVLGGGNEKKYGQQRVWGTVGFGLSALFAGFCVDWWSGFSNFKDYSPAFLIAVIFTSVDILCCSRLQLPELPKSPNILKDVTNLVQDLSIATFLIFAAFVGICESFIIFFLFCLSQNYEGLTLIVFSLDPSLVKDYFTKASSYRGFLSSAFELWKYTGDWLVIIIRYLEDLAVATNSMEHIKLLQGLTVAAETLIGEIIFFPLSGKILEVVGYRHCLSLCFLFYTLRLGLLSLIPSPWWALGVELLQGPSYALSYTTVVAYASNISPPGTSATMQGIAAGMDDGFGYSIGSLVGGVLYRSLGGSVAFRVFSIFALTCSVLHWLLYMVFFRKESSTPVVYSQKQEKRNIYNPPKEAVDLVVTAS